MPGEIVENDFVARQLHAIEQRHNLIVALLILRGEQFSLSAEGVPAAEKIFCERRTVAEKIVDCIVDGGVDIRADLQIAVIRHRVMNREPIEKFVHDARTPLLDVREIRHVVEKIFDVNRTDCNGTNTFGNLFGTARLHYGAFAPAINIKCLVHDVITFGKAKQRDCKSFVLGNYRQELNMLFRQKIAATKT